MFQTFLARNKNTRITINTDGAIRPKQNRSGIAVIVKNQQGQIIHWWGKQMGPMTNNEAEYAAVLFALEQAQSLNPKAILILTDSKLIVDQMHGLATARSPRLRKAFLALQTLTFQFDQVTFQHIPREKNRLADALANDFVDGYV